MDVMILENKTHESGSRSFEFAGRKKQVSIFVGNSFTNVCVNHLGSNFYRGGKVFHGSDTLTQALAAYKSSEVREMIQTAIELMA